MVSNPDNKVHGANMGPIWGRKDPGGPHVGPMNFAIWEGDRRYANLIQERILLTWINCCPLMDKKITYSTKCVMKLLIHSQTITTSLEVYG